MDALAARLSSPRAVQHEDRLARVETVRGEQLELYKADDGTYGLIWKSDAVRRENSRAFAELDLISETLTCTPNSAPSSEPFSLARPRARFDTRLDRVTTTGELVLASRTSGLGNDRGAMKKLSSAVHLAVCAPWPAKLETVLYVEDEDDNWQIAHLRLGHAYDLVRARNAQEACDVATARKAELSAILMDIALSGSEFNGVELTEILRGKRPKERLPEYAKRAPILTSTPIIFVTAHVSKYSDAMLMRAGGDRVIPKPVDFAALSLALTQLHLARMQQRRT